PQAHDTRLPLWAIPLPWPCTNAVHEDRMRGVVGRARAEAVSVFAFGDLFLDDIRANRVRQLADTGLAVTPRHTLDMRIGTSPDCPEAACGVAAFPPQRQALSTRLRHRSRRPGIG